MWNLTGLWMHFCPDGQDEGETHPGDAQIKEGKD